MHSARGVLFSTFLLILAGCGISESSGYWDGQPADATQAPSAMWQGWQQKAIHEPLTDLIPSAVRAASLKQQLEWVNARGNAQPFRSDIALWGRQDYWATPREFFAHGGDCEDYALAKMSLLRALGWPEEKLRLVLVQDMGQGGIEHAVLLVQLDGIYYLLDNQTSGLLLAEKQTRYLPRYGMNAQGLWRY